LDTQGQHNSCHAKARGQLPFSEIHGSNLSNFLMSEDEVPPPPPPPPPPPELVEQEDEECQISPKILGILHKTIMKPENVPFEKEKSFINF